LFCQTPAPIPNLSHLNHAVKLSPHLTKVTTKAVSSLLRQGYGGQGGRWRKEDFTRRREDTKGKEKR
jgi:hypothetical protein